MNPNDILFSEDAFGKGPRERAVSVRWLGTAGFSLTCEGTTLLIDPYITRASLRECLESKLVSNEAAVLSWVPRADAIVLGHTHFDHALDAPLIAKRTGARVFGSRSAAALCLSEGVDPSRVEVVERPGGGDPVVREVGPFQLAFIPSVHSALVLGRVPFPGDIADCDHVPMRAHRYRCGAVFGVQIAVGGRVLYHLGSADLIDHAIPMRHTDLLLLTVAGWTASRDVPERVIRSIDPAAVLLSHWDDFLRPIDRPAEALPAMRLGALVERLDRAARGIPIGTLPIGGHVYLPL